MSITIEKLNDPDSWPHWPLLPMKRKRPDSFQEHGICVDISEWRTRVYQVNLYSLTSEPLGEQLKDIPYIEYRTTDEIVYNGNWRVD